MVGGVAAAVGTGALPTPFDSGEPAPASSVSAPERPLVSPPPKDALSGENRPDDGSRAPVPDPDDSRAPGGGAEPGPGATAGERRQDRTGGSWRGTVTSGCRDLRDGKRLGDDRRRALEGAAGGSARVSQYCKAVLGAAEDGEGHGNGQDEDEDRDDQGGDGDGEGRSHGRGNGNGRGHGHPGNDHRADGAVTGTPSSPLAPLLPERGGSQAAPGAPSASPSPVHSVA